MRNYGPLTVLSFCTNRSPLMNRYSETIPHPSFTIVLDPTSGIIGRREETKLVYCVVWPDDIDDISPITDASYTEIRIVGRHSRLA